MGWDGYANNTKGHLDKFKAASARVLDKANSVDCLLEKGALDCSACAYWLQEITGQSAWGDNGWSPEQVKDFVENAHYPDLEDIERDDWWAFLSAKEFLEVCAEIGTGVHFSY